MPTSYKVIGKAHRRTSHSPQYETFPNGAVRLVMQPGPMVTVPVDAILDDVTPEELAAFPDRFRAASSDEVAAWEKRKADVRQAFLPLTPEAVDPKRAELAQQIAQLQAQLAAMPQSDPVRARLERAPVDPATSERAAQEREALRQAVADQQAQAQSGEPPPQPPQPPQPGEPPPQPPQPPQPGEPPKPDEPPRPQAERNVAGGQRTESRK